MNLSSTEMIIAAVAVVMVLVVVTAVIVVVRRRRRAQLQERFGQAAYARAVDRTGSRRAAEQQLEERAARRAEYEVRDLSSGDRALFRSRFEAIEASFLDGPDAAVRNADELLDEVVARKGYPEAGADARLEDLAADHPAATDRYRSSRARPGKDGAVTTEQHRQALLGSRALFEAVVGEDPDGPTTGSLAFRDLIAEDEGGQAADGQRHHEPTGH